MSRKPTRPSLAHEVVPVAPHCDCGDLCVDISCPHFWDWLPADPWVLPGGTTAKATRVPVDLDADVYEAVRAEVTRNGATVADVLRAIVRQWADGQARR
jgi:hypothetical protein